MKEKIILFIILKLLKKLESVLLNCICDFILIKFISICPEYVIAVNILMQNKYCIKIIHFIFSKIFDAIVDMVKQIYKTYKRHKYEVFYKKYHIKITF